MLIDVSNLAFRWQPEAPADLAIDASQVSSGECLFNKGPSGSGKSTLLSLLAGVTTAGAGSVRVMGTTTAYFDRYRYARDRQLVIAERQRFAGLYDAVIGAEVAEKLGYEIGDPMIVAHGASDVSFARHDDKPFRSVGARPGHVFALIMGEAVFLTLIGVLLGLLLLYVLLLVGQPVIESRFGIFSAIGGLSPYEWILLGAVMIAGFLVGSIPSYRAYRLSLADGLSVTV